MGTDLNDKVMATNTDKNGRRVHLHGNTYACEALLYIMYVPVDEFHNITADLALTIQRQHPTNRYTKQDAHHNNNTCLPIRSFILTDSPSLCSAANGPSLVKKTAALTTRLVWKKKKNQNH